MIAGIPERSGDVGHLYVSPIYSLPGPPCFALANFPDRNDALVVLSRSGSVIRSSVLALEADGLVDEQVASDRVAGSDDSEANDNT